MQKPCSLRRRYTALDIVGQRDWLPAEVFGGGVYCGVMAEVIDGVNDDSTLFHKATQVLLPTFTILGFLLTSLKRPEIGLILNLFAQIFWINAGWQAWKKAKQIGILITVLLTTLIIIYGVINYWVL